MEQQKKERKVKLNKRTKDLLKTFVCVSMPPIAISLYFVGRRAGIRKADMAFSRGIQKCWDHDPTLEEHMNRVAEEILNNK